MTDEKTTDEMTTDEMTTDDETTPSADASDKPAEAVAAGKPSRVIKIGSQRPGHEIQVYYLTPSIDDEPHMFWRLKVGQ